MSKEGRDETQILLDHEKRLTRIEILNYVVLILVGSSVIGKMILPAFGIVLP